jgi:hypothetical protein
MPSTFRSASVLGALKGKIRMPSRPSAVAAAAISIATIGGLAFHPATTLASAPASTALIIGRVIDGTTGAAIRGATVTIGGAAAPRTGNTVLVDSQGRFLFSGLAAGTFTLRAQRNGFLPGAYGQTQPEGQGQSIELREDERRIDVTIRLWRYASISGRALDEAGEPVAGVYVSAFRRTWLAGRPSLSGSGSLRPTDDRGVYRIGRMPPGEYVVGITTRLVTFPIAFVEADVDARQAGAASQQTRSADLTAKGASPLGTVPTMPSTRIGRFAVAMSYGLDEPLPVVDGRVMIFPITFHPSASTTESATPVILNAGDQRLGVDLHLRLTPTVSISGIATGPDGPIENLGLRLQLGPDSQFQSRRLVEPAHTVTSAGGAFTLLGVPPGSFTLVAAVSAGQGPAISTALPLTVGDRDLKDVALTLHPNSQVSGRLEFDGASEKPPFPWVGQVLGLDPVDGHFERITFKIEPDGTMPAVSVPPGRYFVRVGVPGAANPLGPWTLKSAMVGGRDVSDVPMTVGGDDITGLVVTFTDRAAALTGTVRNAQNVADATATVLVFPTDRALWIDYGALPRRLRAVRTDRTGAFSIPALPAGDYYAIAVAEDATTDWLRQAFLTRAAGMATRVTIAEGAGATVNLMTSR